MAVTVPVSIRRQPVQRAGQTVTLKEMCLLIPKDCQGRPPKPLNPEIYLVPKEDPVTIYTR